jgi:hypothetical protein
MKSLNVFMVKRGFEHVGSATSPNDDNADYRPILREVINTNCNYDGDKIEGLLE